MYSSYNYYCLILQKLLNHSELHGPGYQGPDSNSLIMDALRPKPLDPSWTVHDSWTMTKII